MAVAVVTKYYIRVRGGEEEEEEEEEEGLARAPGRGKDFVWSCSTRIPFL